MGMSFAYGPTDESEALRVLRRYVDLGGNFFDTAEIYGPYANEQLLGRFLREISRDHVVVATKFGFKIDKVRRTPDSSPANVRRACDGSLERLGVDVIDLFYQHRVDPNVPIEETVGAMAELVSAGKVRALGLSEAGPETLRRAAKCIRSQRCRASIRFGPVMSRQTAFLLPAVNWVSHLFPTVRSVAGS
jgi:aryl-alcohol dehydrogenase-like predicted oxidoreductase